MNVNKLFFTGLVLSSLLLLGGCKSGPEVTAEDAAEVALDDAGFKSADVSDLVSNPTSEGFDVSFHTAKGTFNYVISQNGLIQDRSYDKNGTPESAAEESAPEPEQKTETADKKKAEEPAEKEEEPDESYSAEEQLAINLALNNAGVSEVDVTGLKVKMDGDEATVTFHFGDYTNIVTVDTASQTVISTLIQ